MTSPRAALPTARDKDIPPRQRRRSHHLVISLIAGLSSLAVTADEVQVEDATAHCEALNCRFDVTLRHADTGWDHYANAWRVLDAHGNELGKRTLYHPHVNEQPFTRSLSGINIAPGTRTVWIEAFDSVHGAGSLRFKILLNP